MFKEPLIHQTIKNGPVLNAKEVRDIFCGITSILEVHNNIRVVIQLNKLYFLNKGRL